MKVDKSVFYIIVCVIIFTIFSSCADKITTLEDLTSPQNNTQNSGLSKFSELQKKVFTPTCALSGCHGDNSTQAKLNLTEGKAYANIVNVTSNLFPSEKRVIPGNAALSLVYRVLNHDPGIPLQMPPTGKIDQYIIDSIAVWINKGALHD